MWLALLLFLISFPARAEMPTGLTKVGEGKVAAVLDGRTLRLADGRIVRLVGLAPLPATHAAPAKDRLAGLIAGGSFSLYHGATGKHDRHGRMLGHAAGTDGRWLAEIMLAEGLARLETRPGIGAMAAILQAAEDEARATGRGLWSDPVNAPRDATRPEEIKSGGFQLVEGAVRSVRRIRETVYVNFGEDWRNDFTIEIDRAGLAALRKSRISPFKLEGRKVMVRGAVFFRNGPAMLLTHAEQLQFLDDGKSSIIRP